jgi:DNA-binding transcriptional LysR family regulator
VLYDTNLLHSFAVIADEGGFTRAAERLNLTQSAVSARLRQLEQQVGHRLLRRTTRSILLTPQGEKLLSYTRSILALHADAQASLAGSPHLSGHVRLGVSEDFSGPQLASLLAGFGQSHPAVLLELRFGVPGNLIDEAENGRLDLVLGSRCRGDERGEALWAEPLVWASAERWPVPFARRGPLPVAFFPEPCPYRAAAISALSAAGLDWRIVCESGSVGGVKVAVLAGIAVTPIARSALGQGLLQVGPEAALPDLPFAEFILFAPRRRDRADAAHELAGAIRRQLTLERPSS